MDKSLFSAEYEMFLRRLRQARQEAGLTQAVLAYRLRRNQSFVSKLERGERRVDVVELRVICRAMGISFRGFVDGLDSALEELGAAQTDSYGRGQEPE